MLTYQIILLVLSIIGILFGIYQFRRDSFSNFVLSLWICAWIVVMIVTVFPDITTSFARFFGFGRGLDIVYIISILFLFYIVFKLYNKMEKQKKRINELVSELALKEYDE
ncbi:DUF2304 domain-containing protein [Methanosphaera sp. ISO3-F5]|uniref:DUF2304 domain-containing protein n=1 Tax=Methanosphaera sp. ISO3-F5 TaxID=1452353 RepID=UPI002B25748E|nr:DUF2304 domain-containing protein [Methanosphaera sp. ISO3-F5]WQH63396.1 DUF2304 domain-containing protein [Methanosphaera sp. ISO3-F5]